MVILGISPLFFGIITYQFPICNTYFCMMTISVDLPAGIHQL
jgi:hypothetical protein